MATCGDAGGIRRDGNPCRRHVRDGGRCPQHDLSKRPRTRRLQERFLAAYEECGTILHAAAAVGQDRLNHRAWMEIDPTYPRRFEVAERAFAEKCLEVVDDRAFRKGTPRLKFYKGVPIMVPCRKDDPDAIPVPGQRGQFHKPYVEYQFSDRLAEIRLKKLFPEHREREQPDAAGEAAPAVFAEKVRDALAEIDEVHAEPSRESSEAPS